MINQRKIITRIFGGIGNHLLGYAPGRRLALINNMGATQWSWHSVGKVRANRIGYCVSNYYFSPISPKGSECSNVATFGARLEQIALRAISSVDNKLRQMVRRFGTGGLGKEDMCKALRT